MCQKRLAKEKQFSALLCQKLFVDVVATFALREESPHKIPGCAQSGVQEMRTSCLLSQHVHEYVYAVCVCVPSETPQGVTEAAAAAASVTVAQLQHICVLCCPEDNECTWRAPAQISPSPLSTLSAALFGWVNHKLLLPTAA